MSPEVLASIIVAVLSLGGSAYAARSARRSPRQERRDDFTVVTDRMTQDISRLERRVSEQEVESERQRGRITGQDFTIRYLVGWIRGLVGYIRKSGLEPPAPPQPVPDEARQYLLDIGV